MSKKKIKKQKIKEASVSEDYKYYLKEKEEYLNRAMNKEEYGVKQIDAMLVALSTAGLGFTLNYLKNFKSADYILLAHISQLLFLACLIFMLFAHVSSKRANSIGVDILERELRNDQPWKEEDEDMQEEKIAIAILRSKVRIWNSIIKTLNVTSFCALISAIILFVLFTSLA